jgi:hypothetical protein
MKTILVTGGPFAISKRIVRSNTHNILAAFYVAREFAIL